MTEQSDTRLDGHSPLHTQVQETEEVLIKLSASDPELAATLARILGVVASEAARTPRFARALGKALIPPEPRTASRPAERPRRSRRAPGVIEPFAVFAESGETGLRSRLGELDLEQLRDIVSEHGMDHDRLAMKWKDPQRVIDRIVERVESRTAKGAAFRGRPEQSTTPHGEDGEPKVEDPPA
ncbi:hypothetical protein [Streptomyces fungicidicus]